MVSLGSLLNEDVEGSHFFRLTQVASVSIALSCRMSDLKNETSIKIENGIRSLGIGAEVVWGEYSQTV